MRHTTTALAAALLQLLFVQAALSQDNSALIAEAVRPLPADLRDDATVYTYDSATGERTILRQGNNQVECTPNNPETGFTRCYARVDSARRDLAARLVAQGRSDEETSAAIAEAEAAGTIPPATPGAIRYRIYDGDDRIRFLWVVTLPNATPEQLGMSTAPQRDNALAGQGLPWMMREGTPEAHLMIPVNGTAYSNPGGARARLDTKIIDDPIEQATLPLPEDLRADATVVRYNSQTGAREVLRQGSNMIECQPRNAETGFTMCYHRDRGPEQDLRARLAAEGKSDEDVAAAVQSALASGELKPPPFGSLAYRLYEEDDRLKLLWVMLLPNATADELGMSVASQRDAALAGEGLPWMMLEGTPSAHLMIPINATELSN